MVFSLLTLLHTHTKTPHKILKLFIKLSVYNSMIAYIFIYAVFYFFQTVHCVGEVIKKTRQTDHQFALKAGLRWFETLLFLPRAWNCAPLETEIWWRDQLDWIGVLNPVKASIKTFKIGRQIQKSTIHLVAIQDKPHK